MAGKRAKKLSRSLSCTPVRSVSRPRLIRSSWCNDEAGVASASSCSVLSGIHPFRWAWSSALGNLRSGSGRTLLCYGGVQGRTNRLIKSICSTVSEARAAAPGEYISRRFSGLSPATQANCEDASDYACPAARTPTGEGRGRSVIYLVLLRWAVRRDRY